MIRNEAQTAETNMAVKRTLENRILLLDVSHVSRYFLRNERSERLLLLPQTVASDKIETTLGVCLITKSSQKRVFS